MSVAYEFDTNYFGRDDKIHGQTSNETNGAGEPGPG